jgi:hypothetical protein
VCFDVEPVQRLLKPRRDPLALAPVAIGVPVLINTAARQIAQRSRTSTLDPRRVWARFALVFRRRENLR